MNDYVSKKTVLIIVIIGSFIVSFMGSSINVALPDIEKTFKINAVLLSWIATAYLLATGVILVPSGRAGDIYGRKKILSLGFAFYSIFSLLSALSISAPMLVLFRILQGIGCGMIYAANLAILVSVFPPQERGKVLGISVTSTYTGLSSGPFVGGMLTLHFTWRSLFFFNFIFGSLVFFVIIWKLKGEWAEAKGEKLDIIGALVYGITLIMFIYGLSVLPSLNSIWMILTGLLGMFIFLKWENRIKHPIFEISIFKRNKVFALSNLAALIHYSATFAITFLMSFYFQYIRGYNPQITGVILMSQPIMMALFSSFAGKLSDRIEPRIIATIGMSITCCMLFVLSFVQESTNLMYPVSCLLFLGFGYALFSSPNMNAIMGSVDKKYLGIASGATGTMRLIGQMFSMGVATLVITLFVGHVQITVSTYPNLLHSIRISFIIFSVICFGGIFASMVRGNIRSN